MSTCNKINCKLFACFNYNIITKYKRYATIILFPTFRPFIRIRPSMRIESYNSSRICTNFMFKELQIFIITIYEK